MSEMEPKRRTPARELFTGILLIFVVGAAIMLGVWAMRLHALEAALRSPASPAAQSETQPAASRVTAQPSSRAAAGAKTQSDDSTVQHVRRLIELEHGRNLAAIETARLRLEDDFRRYSERIPQFTDALNSLGEKARLAKTLLQDKSQTGNATEQEAAKLFGENVVPLDKLRNDIADVVARFERDVAANRSVVLASAGPELDLPGAPLLPAAGNMDLLLADFTGQLGRFLGSQAEEVPTSTVSSLAKSMVVEEAMRKKVSAAMESHDSEPRRAAIVGTAVGVLAGAADYWLMQSRFESALTSRCQAALDKIRVALWSAPNNGLEASFTNYVDLVNESHLLALKRGTGK